MQDSRMRTTSSSRSDWVDNDHPLHEKQLGGNVNMHAAVANRVHLANGVLPQISLDDGKHEANLGCISKFMTGCQADYLQN
eukprot:5617283-Amphidinium_carterae.2